MIALTRSRVFVLAIVGVMIASLLGFAIQGIAGEKVLLSSASSKSGYQLAPNGSQAQKADSTSGNTAPGVAEVGPDGKVKFVSGKSSGGGSGSYTANNSGSRNADD